MFKPWPGPMCCVLGQDTFSHSASLHSGVLIGDCEGNAGGNPVMDTM